MSGVRFHINPATGEVRECHAEKKCRFGLAENEHYSTKEEAQAAYEKQNEGNVFNKKVSAKIPQDFIDEGERIADEMDYDWLPEVENPKTGEPVESLYDFQDPEIASDNCYDVSSCVEDYMSDDDQYDVSTIVENVDKPYLTNHAANIFEDKESGEKFVVDFSYSQIDPDAKDFPHISTLKQWKKAIYFAGDHPHPKIKKILDTAKEH